MSAVAELKDAPIPLTDACEGTRAGFSAYLDGALDGHTMAQLAAHLRECGTCAGEFAAWRSMQAALGELGPARVPVELQARLRDVLAGEIGTGRHLSPLRRFGFFFERTLAPMGLRFGAGLAATVLLLGSGAWVLGTALPVQANDERMAHMNAPKFLYSQTSPEPIATGGAFVNVLVDAKVNAAGRVYDFELIEGPRDAETRLRVEQNLLSSVFKPATVFGEPVPGHVIVSYSAVTAHV